MDYWQKNIELEKIMELFVLFILVVSFLWGSQPQFTFLHEMDQFLQDICEEQDNG